MLAAFLTLLLAAATPGPSPSPSPAATSSVTGELVSVDVARGTLSLSRTFRKPKPTRSPEVLTLVVTPATELFRASRPAALAELRPGDHVVARYVIGPGGGRALSIRAAEPAPPKVPAAAPTAAAPAPGG